MISFEPLYRTLKERGISKKQASMIIYGNESGLRMATKGVNVRTTTVLKICEALHCDIADLICCTEEKVSLHYSVNWDKLRQLDSFYRLAKQLGKCTNFFISMKARDGKISLLDARKICELYNCKLEDFTL